MRVHHEKADLGNLGEEFLDNDPQQGSDMDTFEKLESAVDRRDSDDPANLAFPPQYAPDLVLSQENDAPGPLDTEFIAPAPSQPLYADEEPGGMFGSTADELLGDDGPDGRDLGDSAGDFSGVSDSFAEIHGTETVEVIGGRNRSPSAGIEDQLAVDLPIGGTTGDIEDVVDPETGELTDYDDDKQTVEL